ncbi:hypothetical protein OOZ63_00870 [Paucibacter sp. PLA-PC-4]|uniref:hypothetical protein n=1 Tax=Paucibacter sp. PLA-PC-4 TaxID=2993655 RepID=UPI002248FFA5|nr:hypothetical protein [Paucibacter sp. PLA-PC-4]MCX2860390.1 hypothetical protein [Paucibacter sp. PLA-PC-4]
MNKAKALVSLLFDAYRRRGWVLMYSPQDKTPLPQTLSASAPSHDESAASAQALLDEVRLSHPELVDFIEGAARLSGKP